MFSRITLWWTVQVCSVQVVPIVSSLSEVKQLFVKLIFRTCPLVLTAPFLEVIGVWLTIVFGSGRCRE